MKAIRFIFNNKLAWVFIFPIIISTLLLIFGLHISGQLSNALQEWLLNKLHLDSPEETSNFLSSLIKGAIWVLLKVIFFFVFAYTSGYIVVILLSPVFAWLSEKTEEKLTGKTYPFSLKQFIKDIWRGIRLAFRNFLIEMIFIIVVLIAGFIPGIGWLTSFVGLIALFFISAYFYGFGFIDYYIERKKLNVKQSIFFIRSHKGLAIGNGIIFSLVLLFPVVGALISPFLAIVSVVSSVITMENADIEFDYIEYN